MRLRFWCVAVLFLTLVTSKESLLAQSIQVSIPNPIPFSSSTTYSIAGNFPGTPTAYQWEWQASCNSQWYGLGSTSHGSTTSTNEVFVGVAPIRCKVTYRMYNGSTGTTTLTTSVTVAPPDDIEVASGDGISLALGSTPPVIFDVYSKGAKVYRLTGWAQERIYNARRGDGTKLPRQPNPNWLPPLNGGTGKFTINRNQIIDAKRYSPGQFQANYNNLPTGPFNIVSQDVRVLIPDVCGTYTPYVLGTFECKFIKVDNSHYSLSHTK